MYFNEEVILLNQTTPDSTTALTRLASLLVEKGLVADSFPTAVLAREEIYPTGLDLGTIGVAIPHTDAEHVIRPQLGFMSLTQPVQFRQMGDESAVADVSLIIMLALDKAEDQVPMLQQLMGLLQDQASLDALRRASVPQQVVDTFIAAGVC